MGKQAGRISLERNLITDIFISEKSNWGRCVGWIFFQKCALRYDFADGVIIKASSDINPFAIIFQKFRCRFPSNSYVQYTRRKGLTYTQNLYK